ncbi:Altered inheritance of mitochondria protein 18 mitochondrial [Orbilia ellipsospora]|uniref:Altered inheritance of mitochondria protein 18 mitochondrial n=1 Tax=Orbilia ellipsospora TaxID=2528407 RepID=A0AAV9XQU0_9PEZI
MKPALRCLQLQRQAVSRERHLLRNLLPRGSEIRPVLPLSRFGYPRHTSSAAPKKNPYKPTFHQKPHKDQPKYPPIKPDPHKAYLAEQAHLARPTLDPKGQFRFRLSGEALEKKQRRVDRQIAIALVLFIGTIVATQIWLPRNPKLPMGIRTPREESGIVRQDADISPSDRKRFEEASRGGNVIIRQATSIGQTVETVPSGTSSVGPIPKQIFLPSGVSQSNQVLEEYTYVGHGIRTVSFLSIQVYVVALYVATSSLPALQQQLLKSLDVPSSATTATLPERESLKSNLLSENGSIDFFSTLLDARDHDGVKMAIRIVPTRGTDYPHLRDGWVRGIQGKTKLQPELYDDDIFLDSLGRFKAIFGGRKGVPKGRALILARDQNGALFAYGPDDTVKNEDVKLLSEGAGKTDSMHGLMMLGVMDDPRVTRALWLCYFAGKKVASEGARKSVVDGLVEVVSRPVGSTEGKVV